MSGRIRTLLLEANGTHWVAVCLDTIGRGRLTTRGGARGWVATSHRLRKLFGERYADASYLADWRDAFLADSHLDVSMCNVTDRLEFRGRRDSLRDFDLVVVETVGVGQSETAVASMTDMFVLLQLPNAGDDLQAIKRGVMELADLVAINKTDLDAAAAMRAQAQITSSLRTMQQQGHPDERDDTLWKPRVLRISAVSGEGLADFWSAVSEFRRLQTDSGRLTARRHEQDEAWMWERIESLLRERFRGHSKVAAALPGLRDDVRAGRVAASVAARRLIALMN